MTLRNKRGNSQKHPELYSVMLIDPSGRIVQYKNHIHEDREITGPVSGVTVIHDPKVSLYRNHT